MTEDSIRRTWWLLAGSFLLLIVLAVLQVVTERRAIDWLLLIAVLVAAVAAVGHQNAVATLEARRRADAESYARILRGLSRSVSPESIVNAIIDELIAASGADHVAVVRRLPDRSALIATLVTSRAGVPTTSTHLDLAVLDAPIDQAVARAEAASTDVPAGGRDTRSTAPAARVANVLRRSAIEAAGLLRDLGVPIPVSRSSDGPAAVSESLGDGVEAAITERIAAQVRSAFGLPQTLAAPIRTEAGLLGAVILSRRDRGTWPASARQLLFEAARETAAALERATSLRRVEAQATTDPLTGLPNRRYFDEYARLLARRRRSGDAVSALMIDIDHFKRLNESYGHPVGDVVLKRVAAAIATTVREDDVPARVGGEEFAVLLRNPGPAVAVEVGERVRQAVRTLDLSGTGVTSVSVSVGVANAASPEEAIPDLVERADEALRRAKRAGRDRVVAAD